ncbi:restriction endonuclease subunit S [Staphylococcus sp. RIT622]|uniref:restriction endonuclease subunit S n=1 Tax=Staphylococcus sp. RIT622 TaxID=2510795 RepID=UPI00101E4953|nr:restriction endonuclease subunit S [Staphylococcus sp. RIT622]RYL11923.1 restriction endonuclease subunit S [Staphylococcus sp. RIT622]
MTNELKNVPELRFPKFTGEWEENQLSKLTRLLKDGTHGTHKDVENGAWLLSAKNIKNNSIIFDESDRMISYDDYHKIYKNYQLQKDDLLLSIVGTIGQVALVKDPTNLAFQRSVAIIRFENRLSNSFFLYLFQTNTFRKKLLRNQVVSAQPGLYLGDLGKFFVDYPLNYKEQEKIGNFFSKLDRQIELEEQKLEKLEEQKKGYMQQIFSQQLRFKDENGNEYPEWEEKKLGDILERGNKDKVNEIGKYRRLTISLHGKGLYEVKQERKTKDTRPFYQRFEGELIIGKQNFFNGSIAIVTREFNGFICSNAIMSYKISNHINRKYLLEYLLQNDFLRKNEYLADGTGQKELSEKKFEELEIKLPNSINEQQKIGVFLERLDNLIEKQSNKLELLKQRKKSFLQKMFV